MNQKWNTEVVYGMCAEHDIEVEAIRPYHLRLSFPGRKLDYFPKSGRAKTEIEFASTNDFKGSAAIQKIEKCKTNLTYNFILNIPIFKGTTASTFPVDIEFEPTDGTIVCWLMSDDLAELEIKHRDTIMDNEVNKFQSVVVIKK